MVDVNILTPDKRRVDISEDPRDGVLAIEFTYSVRWNPSAIPYEQRMDKYRQYQINPQHLEV